MFAQVLVVQTGVYCRTYTRYTLPVSLVHGKFISIHTFAENWTYKGLV